MINDNVRIELVQRLKFFLAPCTSVDKFGTVMLVVHVMDPLMLERKCFLTKKTFLRNGWMSDLLVFYEILNCGDTKIAMWALEDLSFFVGFHVCCKLGLCKAFLADGTLPEKY